MKRCTKCQTVYSSPVLHRWCQRCYHETGALVRLEDATPGACEAEEVRRGKLCPHCYQHGWLHTDGQPAYCRRCGHRIDAAKGQCDCPKCFRRPSALKPHCGPAADYLDSA